MKNRIGIIVTGVIVGIMAVALVMFGNPANMGVCVACFIRDTAGGLGLHRAEVVQYIRPEVSGMILGALILAIAKKEFKPKGGSSPFTRFMLGFFVMIGALMFLGCPLRMILRLGGGDLNALVGLVGFTAGIVVGIFALNKGFSLGRTYNTSKAEGAGISIIAVVLLILLVVAPTFIFFSKKGPGSAHAPIAMSLIAGLVLGGLAQRTRLCMVGGIRDLIMFKDSYLISGYVAMLIVVIIGNLAVGKFNLGFANQPIAHTDAVWNFLGMALAGWGSVLLGGCPLRQLILSGEGNSDSAVTVLGLLVGAAFAHNFKLAASPEGPTPNGMVAVIIGFVVLALVTYFNIKKSVELVDIELKEEA